MSTKDFKCVWTLGKTNTVAVARFSASDGTPAAIPVVLDLDAEMSRLHFRFLGARLVHGRPRIVATSAFLKLPRAVRGGNLA